MCLSRQPSLALLASAWLCVAVFGSACLLGCASLCLALLGSDVIPALFALLQTSFRHQLRYSGLVRSAARRLIDHGRD